MNKEIPFSTFCSRTSTESTPDYYLNEYSDSPRTAASSRNDCDDHVGNVSSTTFDNRQLSSADSYCASRDPPPTATASRAKPRGITLTN
ncbi:hypothetical protein POX_f08173 [Penicillium oxalicum]|uniref:hypothetical protein n=1 Tax=Penicillium oxalicum TaxID=69781 RepID=UPI0020B7A3B4|nr:hypothetical protein POX_f08173 [Penicillium oxalicum]KAI2787796.1 hypothetical protein POX_f08173 [Penicillium oxalicum]